MLNLFVYLCVLPRVWTPRPYHLSVPCLFSCVQYTVYKVFYFPGMPLTLIGMPILNCFIIKPNVGVADLICPSIIFPVNSDGIKDCLKYWIPYPMIIRVLPWMVL